MWISIVLNGPILYQMRAEGFTLDVTYRITRGFLVYLASGWEGFAWPSSAWA